MISRTSLIPEALASLTFLPLGIAFGNLMVYYYILSLQGVLHIAQVKPAPFIVGGFAGAMAGAFMSFCHSRQKTINFVHFYVMAFGLTILLVGSIVMAAVPVSTAAIFLIFIGNGIVYTPALSYINVRSGTDSSRVSTIALAHGLFIAGIAIACVVNFVFVFVSQFSIDSAYPRNFDLNAILTTSLSGLIIIAIIIQELSQRKNGDFNYKKSLDTNIQREIESKTIFDRKYFPLIPNPDNCFAGQNVAIQPSTTREVVLTVFAFVSKVQSMMYIYAPFHFFNYLTTTLYLNDELVYIPTLMAVGGYIISMVFMALSNYKLHYVVVSGLQILAFIQWILYLNLLNINTAWSAVVITTWVIMMFLSLTRPHADINILTYTRLKYADFNVGIAYFGEYIVLGILQFLSILHPNRVFGSTGTTFFSIIGGHVIAFFVVIILTACFGAAVIPCKRLFRARCYVSLLEVKNYIHNAQYLVSGGQRNYGENVIQPVGFAPNPTSNVMWQQPVGVAQNYPQEGVDSIQKMP